MDLIKKKHEEPPVTISTRKRSGGCPWCDKVLYDDENCEDCDNDEEPPVTISTHKRSGGCPWCDKVLYDDENCEDCDNDDPPAYDTDENPEQTEEINWRNNKTSVHKKEEVSELKRKKSETSEEVRRMEMSSAATQNENKKSTVIGNKVMEQKQSKEETQTNKESNFEDDKTQKQQETLPCKYCNKIIGNKKELNIHERFRCRESRCAVCNKKFENNYELQTHEIKTHKFIRNKNETEA